MSSHHFVKEGQEPAVIIVEPVAHSSIAFLLEWAPQVVVLDNAMADVLDWGIKVDVAVTTLENRDATIHKLVDQMPVKVLTCNDPEEALATAFYYLLSVKQFNATLVAREPEQHLSVVESFSDRLEVTVMNERVRWLPVKNGHFAKWLPQGASLLTRQSPDLFTVEGNINWSDNTLTAQQDSMIKVSSPGFFWIGELL